MSIRLLRGDCRVSLDTIEPGSVQSCITSPPYYGLRDYGTPALVWGGAAEREQCGHPCKDYFEYGSCDCTINGGAKHVHEWLRVDEFHNRGDDSAGPKQKSNNGAVTGRGVVRYGTCPCGAWLGSLGLEPSPELYIEHIVECFRAVRRVLRDDGTLWLNLGDSYAGSGKGPTGHNGFQGSASVGVRIGSVHGDSGHTSGVRPPPGLKAKDLQMMPARVAMALQADGWWLRSMIPWLKRNAMPESVTDRPATSVEYVFLLSKSRTYYWDADAVRMAQSVGTLARFGEGQAPRIAIGPKGTDPLGNNGSASGTNGVLPSGRNRRNSDWFFESWQGLMLDEQDDPLALVVNPQPYSGAHFATFPPKLVEPMVKASTRPGDTILDPFGGAGTVGLVADRLGRNAVLCELSDQYSPMATDRLIGDSPMFTEVEVA